MDELFSYMDVSGDGRLQIDELESLLELIEQSEQDKQQRLQLSREMYDR